MAAFFVVFLLLSPILSIGAPECVSAFISTPSTRCPQRAACAVIDCTHRTQLDEKVATKSSMVEERFELSGQHKDNKEDGEVLFSEPDIYYGQACPIETEEVIKTKIEHFEEELSRLPADEKENWNKAQKLCPNLLVDDAHKLMFLRSELLDAKLAAIRLARYWDMRVELFGPTKAFEVLTPEEALRDDAVALHTDFFRMIFGAKDPLGRSILFVDPSLQDRSKYTRESMLRAVWYIVHEALQNDETTQRVGVVFIGYPKNAKLSHWDPKLSKSIWKSLNSVLPVRIAAIHFIQPAKFFSVVYPIVSRLFMGERLRKLVHIHVGSDEQVLETLSTKYGLEKDVFPPNTISS